MKKLLIISLLFNAIIIGAGLYVVQMAGGWEYVMYRLKNRGLAKIYEHRKNQFEVLPGKNKSIIFLGDSLTEHGQWSELFGSDTIMNRGIAGDHCDRVMLRLESLKKLNPEKIFLLIGVNDLAFDSPKKVIKKYQDLLTEVLKQFPETTLYLESLLPVNKIVSPTLPMDNDDIDEVNEAIQKMAQENNLTYIDLNSKLTDADGNLHAKYTMDGIHLNGEGYLELKNALVSFVEN